MNYNDYIKHTILTNINHFNKIVYLLFIKKNYLNKK